jgi:hypothetical protein
MLLQVSDDRVVERHPGTVVSAIFDAQHYWKIESGRLFSVVAINELDEEGSKDKVLSWFRKLYD